MRILGIIPARGGSKGVPRKNIKALCGKPLLAYTVESALGSKHLTRLVLTTDDHEIAETGRMLGVEVPFVRPAELARDETPMFPVVRHAVETVEGKEERFDAVCLLQPTNPLRTADDIDRCIEILRESGADSVISVLRVPDVYNPRWVYEKNEDDTLQLFTGDDEPIARRQDLPPAFHREGSIYVTRRSVIDEFGNLYGTRVLGYRIDSANSINIDTEDDWDRAERQIAARYDSFAKETSPVYEKSVLA